MFKGIYLTLCGMYTLPNYMKDKVQLQKKSYEDKIDLSTQHKIALWKKSFY